MLAGRMKLRDFVLIVGVIGVLAVAGLYLTCGKNDEVVGGEKPTADKPAPAATAPAAGPKPDPGTPASPTPAAAPAGPSERAVDRAIMQWAGKSLGSDKKKDVTKGQPFKVNLYQDAGKPTMNRAKVDLDRDDKWDEKWTFDGESITRQVAPADDENYTEKYLWSGKTWTKE